jgi:phospholipid-translocating ATPase
VQVALGQRALPPSKDGRHICLGIGRKKPLIDERRGHTYISNNIRTSRYTIYDFLPKQLFFQFTRLGNFYFLCIGIPQTIPGLSTTGNFTTILPLLFFVLLTIVKEGYDDFKRHRLDKIENANSALVLRAGRLSTSLERAGTRFLPFQQSRNEVAETNLQDIEWRSTAWSNIKVGDVIKLRRDEAVPADIVLLFADGENNLAYIETMALDGETNLKSKEVPPDMAGCDTIEGLGECRAEFVVEDPNPNLYRFDGRVTVNDKTMPLTLNQVVYRGSILRNTKCAIGLVINTGEECKIRMNANQHPKAKKPALERVSNRIVLTLVAYMVTLSVGCSVGYIMWQRSTEQSSWFLNGAAVPFHEIIIGFLIQFNNVIPLALYISLEIVKVGQLLMLNSDIEMYDEVSDTPARCNTNTILENLGQVGYIFTDKTGTITENVMKYRKMSIAGTAWLHETDLPELVDPNDPQITPASNLQTASMMGDTGGELKTVTFLQDSKTDPQTSQPPIRTSIGRRSSSHWRSSARPDHVQPDLTTSDLLEFMRLRPHAPFTRKAKEYLLAMALCHTCLPETKNDKIEYQAASPDELALVTAARELGYIVLQRSSQSVVVQINNPEAESTTQTFEILDVIEFSSKRKRMSVVLKYPDGRISVLCKGADSAILPRLKLAHLAIQKAHEVRKSADLEHELHRQSEQKEPRNSFGGRPSLAIRRSSGISRTASIGPRNSMALRSKSFEIHKLGVFDNRLTASIPAARTASFDVSPYSTPQHSSLNLNQLPDRFRFLENSLVWDDAAIFTQCFKHLDEFATEGLRTLLFAQRFLSEQDYKSWKKIYNDATTSLTDRQERIEAAGELVEQSLDLIGASAIEDKLQRGVPETIEKLRRANIRIWMLTGDKRETAINVAHSARICRASSDLFILDPSKGSLDSQLSAITEDLQSGSIHSVVVVDGHSLSIIEQSPTLSAQFYAVMPVVDSVICCRASPAQKALLVRTIRSHLRHGKGKKLARGLTLAIGDGANDLAMIQASHVGVGISGNEGLQAARVADYAIAQFRFLQRLLLVHGRWNYIRTAKFILCTFWKEMFFYLSTAIYQRYNGYTGTSLYESASLTVFNTLFTSLCVLCMGIWEQDLNADTLLAVPELYVFGQRDMGLNLAQYTGWMAGAAIEGVIAWFGVWAGYGWFVTESDQGLFALGDLAFSIGVTWINVKLLYVPILRIYALYFSY